MLVQTVNGIPGNWSSGNKIRELYISGKCPVQEIGIQIIDIGKSVGIMAEIVVNIQDMNIDKILISGF
ncbi:hypothetical protein RIR_jg39736.t1 [Rhizophagus irregularis DAOM 181602=DAOM 197198]|uniref:Uncharacterized protein n=1 Tax=Rhizophagus irregularis (strain DAOM 181602 / DAOM 197198 / MUCL 43194) TaxID=747089 RepID=U9UTW3_RHIID|nr:hypothetical protein RIR_jg39736.t1 [Rhizophagus irregularis DAOM 181602=DAOM 197198]